MVWRLREGHESTKDVFKIPDSVLVKLYFRYWFTSKMKLYTWAQGLGRFNSEELYKLMRIDLETVSTLLGDKKFILGDTPCENDCAIFGQLAQVLWGMPNSYYSMLLNGIWKHKNLNNNSIYIHFLAYLDLTIYF